MAFITSIIVTFVILQILYVLKILKQTFPAIRDKRWYRFSKTLFRCGPVVIFIIASIIIYFHKIIGLNFHQRSSKWMISLHSIVFGYLWFNSMFNYFATMITKPGRPPSQEELDVESSSYKQQDEGQLEFCSKCKRLRSYGTHHCDLCHTCIRMLCHHSSFANNCVGITNFAYYFSFLCYSYVGLMYLLYMTYSPFQACFLHDHTKTDISLKYPALSFYVCQEVGEVPLFFIAVLASAFIIGSLLLLHIILLAADLSYISFITHIKESQFTINFLKNLIKKCFQRHRRVKFSVLLKCRKKSWVYFMFPSFNILPDNISADDIFDEEEHSYVQMI